MSDTELQKQSLCKMWHVVEKQGVAKINILTICKEHIIEQLSYVKNSVNVGLTVMFINTCIQ